MKTLMYLFASLALVAVACNDNSGDGNELDGSQKDIPFTEYSLEGTPSEEYSASWVNLDYDEKNYESKILVINNNEELKKYVEGNYPPVDFSKKTLVLVYGYNSGSGFGFDVKFQQIADRNYLITASARAVVSLGMVYWQIAIVVDKLPSKSNIKFNGVIITES